MKSKSVCTVRYILIMLITKRVLTVEVERNNAYFSDQTNEPWFKEQSYLIRRNCTSTNVSCRPCPLKLNILFPIDGAWFPASSEPVGVEKILRVDTSQFFNSSLQSIPLIITTNIVRYVSQVGSDNITFMRENSESDSVHINISISEHERIIDRGKSWFEPGLFTLAVTAADADGQDICVTSSAFLVYNVSSGPRTLACDKFLSADDWAVAGQLGFAQLKWDRTVACLHRFLLRHPDNFAAHAWYGTIFEAQGLWHKARHHLARALHLRHSLPPLQRMVADRQAHRLEQSLVFVEEELAASAAADSACVWAVTEATGGCPGRTAAGHGARASGVTAEDEEGGGEEEEEEELYLSVVMVARHDGSAFCQDPPDACLHRLRVSLSVLLHHLDRVGLARETEAAPPLLCIYHVFTHILHPACNE
jgi:hypothetical protein